MYMRAAAARFGRQTTRCSRRAATWRLSKASSRRRREEPAWWRPRSSSTRRRFTTPTRSCCSIRAADTSTSRRGTPHWRTDMKTLIALFAFMQGAAIAPAPKPADFPQQKQLAPNVYVWSDIHPSGLYTTNDLIVITTDGVLVADGQKDAETTKKMVEGIAKLTKQPIKVVVIGSEHGDHTGGNASFPSTVTYIKSPLASGKETTLRMGNTQIQVLDRGRAHTGTDLE